MGNRAVQEPLAKFGREHGRLVEVDHSAGVVLGVAIALPEGLIVPAVIGIQNMSLIEISRAVRNMGKRQQLRAPTEQIAKRVPV